jgi:multidrug resistance efflux pump
LVTDLRREVGGAGDVHAALGAARAALDDMRAQLHDADLPALSAQLRRTGSAVETLAQGRQTRAVLDTAQADLQRLAPLITDMQNTVSRAGSGVADIQSELMPILEEVRAAVQNLRETTETIRRDPGSVLQQGAPPRDRKP